MSETSYFRNMKGLKAIFLPRGEGRGVETDIRKCFSRRRSRRQFWPGAMTKRQLSYILWHTGRVVTGEGEEIHTPIPSPGNTHSLELSIALFNILDMEKGLYRYCPLDHRLYQVERREVMKEELSQVVPGQDFVADASFLLGISGLPRRIREKYPDSWRNYQLLEAGHFGQQIMLATESLGLATCPVAAFDRENTHRYFSLEEEEEMLYLFPVGVRP